MNENVTYSLLEPTPIGPIWLAASDKGLVAVHIGGLEEEFIEEVKRLTGVEPARNEAPTAGRFRATGRLSRRPAPEF